MKTIAYVLVLAFGCSKGGDDCERLVDKMTAAMSELGDKAKDLDRDKAIEKCRKNIDKIKSDPTSKCILEAEGASAVKECLGKGLGEFKSRGQRTEAKLQLNSIGKRAKTYFGDKAEFPKGKSKMLPAKPC